MNLPFSEDAERALLSCALHGLEAAKPICAKVGVDWFYIPAHQTVYKAVSDLVNTNSPVDWISVLNRLTEALEEIGGKEWLSSLFGVVPSPDNFEHYAAIALDCYDRRRLILNCQQAINAARDGDADSAFNALSVKRTTEPEVDDTLASGLDMMEDLASYLQREEQEGDSFPVGVRPLEALVPKFYPGQLILVGGKRGSCKTGLAVSMVAFGIEYARQDPNFYNRDDEAGDISAPAFDYRPDTLNEDNRSDID
jgi:replicative DNA helicase